MAWATWFGQNGGWTAVARRGGERCVLQDRPRLYRGLIASRLYNPRSVHQFGREHKMLQEPAQELIQTLLLGSFPRDIALLEESQVLLEQVTYADFQLHTLVKQELSNHALAQAAQNETVSVQTGLLVDYLRSAKSNYGSAARSYEEDFYYTVVLAHLYHARAEPSKARETLDAFSIDGRGGAFVAYLRARYYVLLGAVRRDACYSRYLTELHQCGGKTQVAANVWTRRLFRAVLVHMSGGGEQPILLLQMLAQDFSANAVAVVALCNFAAQRECEPFMTLLFRAEYVVHLAQLLLLVQKQPLDFPDATHSNTEAVNFVQAVFTADDVSGNREAVAQLLAPKIANRFLVDRLQKTFQSTVVLQSYIRTLLDLRLYDEALAAFDTYCSYVHTDETQSGVVHNVLDVVQTHAVCIMHFLPQLTHGAFKYTSEEAVVEALQSARKRLVAYLASVSASAGLAYDDAFPHFSTNPLAFLYHHYNPTADEVLLTDVVAGAWHALGQLDSYLATYASPTEEMMHANAAAARHHYKNALIVSTRNVEHLTSYALALAYDNTITAATKLCKFILKRHPEAFATWNLLVLLVSAAEQEAALRDDSVQPPVLDKDKTLERFAEDALNIAAIYALKKREQGTQMDAETRHAILQLKLTHLAAVEARHGAETALAQVVDVFALFRELCDVELDESMVRAVSKRNACWSHRPSVIDPLGELQAKKSTDKHKRESKERERAKRRDTNDTDRKNGKEPHGAWERRLLQRLCLWAASLYLKLGFADEAEQCIVEAETVAPPSVETYTHLGLLTSKSRKFLALQEFERCLELFAARSHAHNKSAYCAVLLGMCKLFIVDDDENNSLFVSNIDRRAGLMRLKNYLESFSTCYPYGANCAEVWHYLSCIYETFDDKQLNARALWRCVALDTGRPVRSYYVCEQGIDGPQH